MIKLHKIKKTKTKRRIYYINIENNIKIENIYENDSMCVFDVGINNNIFIYI